MAIRGSKRLAALDFDSRHLRVVRFRRRRGGTQILSLHRVSMPDGMDLNSADELGGFIGRTLKGLGLSGTQVLMSVPRSQAVLKPLSLPQGTPPAELAGMVQFQIAKELPFAMEEAVVDFTTEPHFDASADSSAAGLDVLVGAVRLPVVDRYRQIAQVAGVGLQRLGLRPYANRRCVDRCVVCSPQERLVLVHITPDETEIDVFGRESLRFSRSAAVAVPPADAPQAQQSQALGALVLEVMRSLQSFMAVHRGESIDGLLVAGDTGIEAAVAEALGERLEARCEVFQPGGALGLPAAPEPSGFIAALGLAISDVQACGGPFDFLNPKRPVVQRDTRQNKAAAAAALIVLALGAGAYCGWRYRSARHDEAIDLRNKVTAAERENLRVKRLQRSLEAVRDWQAGHMPWLDHWAQLASVAPAAQEVYVPGGLSLRLDTTGRQGQISFKARARNREVLNQFREKLDAMGYQPRLDGVVPCEDRVNPDYGFETTVHLVIPPGRAVDVAELVDTGRPADDGSLEMLNRRSGGGIAVRPAPSATPAPAPAASPAQPSRPEGPPGRTGGYGQGGRGSYGGR